MASQESQRGAEVGVLGGEKEGCPSLAADEKQQLPINVKNVEEGVSRKGYNPDHLALI